MINLNDELGKAPADTHLTVRDYFASRAMVKLLETKPSATATERRFIADRAYELADEMIGRRARPRKAP